MSLKPFSFLFIIAMPVVFQCATFAQTVNRDSSTYIISKHVLSVEDGLASREVFCGIQDNDGFMWFGTRNGLNRYDGKSFKLFTKQKNGLAENKIIQLAKDNRNHLFLVYGNPGVARSAIGVGVMDLKTHKVTSLKEVFPSMPFDEKYVYWIANAGDDIAFLVSKPFQYWKLSNGKFELKCEMKLWDGDTMLDGLQTAKGAYHTTTGTHCHFTKEYALLINSMEIGATNYFITPHKVFGLLNKKNTGIVSLTPHYKILLDSAFRFDYFNADGSSERNVPSFKPPLSTANKYIYYRHDNYQNLLAYSEVDGLYFYDFSNWYKLLASAELKIYGGNSLYGFYKDRQSCYWIFTSSGLIKIRIEKNPFAHYFTKAQLNSNADNQARGIFADDETVYAGIWEKFYRNKNNLNECLLNNAGIIYGMCRHNSKMFVGSNNLNELDINKNTVTKHIVNKNAIDVWTVDSVSPDKVLLSTAELVYAFNTTNNVCKEVKYASSLIPKVNFVYRFLNRNDKKIWAVAQNGLFLLNENADAIIDYFGNDKKQRASNLFPFEVIYDAYESNDGIIWFATNGEGLYSWDRNKNNFQQFNITAGLPSDILYRIEPDDYNNLWISTDNGIVRFNTKDFKTNTYNISNGLSHNEFNRTSSYKAKDGRLFFGGLDGVNAFYPKDFVSDSTAEVAPLRIISFNKFSVNENKLIDKTDELLAANKIILNPGDRFFNLEFQLLDFIEGKLNYAYKIEGVDKDWNYITENSIRISGLPFGEYTLYIKGQAHNGQWSKQELIIPLSVLTPFYLRWWFILTSCFFLLFSIVLFFRWRTNRLLKTKVALEKTVSERTEQLKNSLDEKEILLKEIHHRVKNNLQVISALLEMQGSRTQDEKTKAAITESQNRVLSIAFIHQNLYQHDDIKSVEIHSFVNELVRHIHHVFTKPNCEVHVQNNIPQTFLDIDTAVPLGLIINELLTNSYKYAFAEKNLGIVKMEMKKVGEGEFEFVYFDNGKGLPKDFDVSKANTLGLRLIRQLCKQLAGKINYSFDNGSKFEFVLKNLEARSKM